VISFRTRPIFVRVWRRRRDVMTFGAAQPSMHAETFIEAVNNVFVHLPPATEVTLDETRQPPGQLQSATQRARARPRRRISSLGPGGARTITTRSQRH